jgi:hypothetical protein
LDQTLTTSSDLDRLSDKRTLAVIVRLVIDGDGQLLHGDLINEAGRRNGHFTAWAELLVVLQSYIEELRASDPPY